MTMESKNDLFKRYQQEYISSGRPRRSEIITILADATAMNRKSVIRKLGRFKKHPSRNVGAGRNIYYGPDVSVALRELWEMAGEACGELLHPMLGEYVSVLKRDGMWEHTKPATSKLLAMSLGTVKNRIRGFNGSRQSSRGLGSTKPSHLRYIIPVFSGPWKELGPGHGQIDSVIHCGMSSLGDMAYTVNYTDAATYWLVPRCQWNHGQTATLESIKAIRRRLPFALLSLHPDSGSEFVNWQAKGWCDAEGVGLTRSRPGKKNDNMYVEERNGHVVRKYLGYSRFDAVEVVAVINELYEVLGLYLNHFIAVRRSLGRERVGSAYRRHYEKVPKTPYRRVMEHDGIPVEVKEGLQQEHTRLNPLILKKEIERLLDRVYDIQRTHGNPPGQPPLR